MNLPVDDQDIEAACKGAIAARVIDGLTKHVKAFDIKGRSRNNLIMTKDNKGNPHAPLQVSDE